ncbi:uncharacterized protein UTRI_04860_B [Ustilago trichophora]|uniref:JmjC domain-containing protein n=1 Tax=Ustilago trichophora TaxID=86804 RepID=A0A5C3EFH4_9BASI|nr:uncharacterized protein UTRI_04860_B [Ustilago trichophora]
MAFSIVPQRTAAKAAEAKLKSSSLPEKNGKYLTSSSSARSSASHSPSPFGTTSASSAPSGSARTSPARKQAPRSRSLKPRPRAPAPLPDPESSLSEASEDEQEEQVVQLSFNPSSRPKPGSLSDASNRLGNTKVPSPSIDWKQSSSEKEGEFVAQPASTPIRSKRSAARAAQNNIQRSYSDAVLDELTAPVQKKARASTSSHTPASPRTPKSPRPSVSSRTKSNRGNDVDEYRAPSSTSSSSSRSRPSSSSQPPKRGRRFTDDQGLTWEVQSGTCNAPRYRQWRKCVQCIAKYAGDTCRFNGFRAFSVDPDTHEMHPADAPGHPKPAFLSSPDSDEVMDLPSNRTLASESLLEAQANVAKSLLPVLETELQHAKQPDVLRRPRETTCRQMCEFCATSIFSASWFCRRCGREYCPDCKDAIEQPDDSDPLLTKRLGLCDRVRAHNVEDLVPLTRFDVVLLEQEVAAMRTMLADGKAQPSAHSAVQADPVSATADLPQSASNDEQEAAIQWRDIPRHQAGLTADRIIGSLSLRTFEGASFDTATFRTEWAHGEPLLVRNVTPAMQHEWGPNELAARYGEESCLIVRSDTDPPAVEQVSVGEFFSTFGQDLSAKEQMLGKGSWKLKDWPPSAEFKHEFPELYEDFNRAVPAPEYTTREGILNLGSCYPAGVIQPDLGPKMYNAWPASEGVRGQGTTRLHMDIADAVNIMLYAAPPTGDDVPEEHKPGVAAWDIFRAEDADTLRAFLREEHAKLNLKDDPIHIQRFFISAPQRVKLYRKYGVKSWRIYQKAGEAVFIPAGCAHQVCNLTDCVKVAVDFVSPQNVERCFKLTAEFRELVKDYKKAWKEDVLSLRTTLWYAWCTYREMDDKGPNVWAKEQAKVKVEVGERISRKVLQDI